MIKFIGTFLKILDAIGLLGHF